MNDELLQALRDQRAQAMEQRTALKRKMEDLVARIKNASDEAQSLNRQRHDMADPYKVATERVADLTSQIEAEELRRQEEEAAVRAVNEAAKRAAEAARENQVFTPADVGTISP